MQCGLFETCADSDVCQRAFQTLQGQFACRGIAKDTPHEVHSSMFITVLVVMYVCSNLKISSEVVFKCCYEKKKSILMTVIKLILKLVFISDFLHMKFKNV